MTATAHANPQLDLVLSKLGGVVKLPGENKYKALCPCHDDHEPSLSISLGRNGQVLLYCQVCEAPFAKIVAALGLTGAELFPAETRRRQTSTRTRQFRAVYPYRDRGGAEIMQTVRFETDVQDQRFRYRQPNGNGGYVWNIQGVPRQLYNLPELTAAPATTTVYLCEGEKDAQRLIDAGRLATTCPLGASKWGRLADDAVLNGHPLVILPDNDGPGRKHANDVAARLRGRCASVKIVTLTGLPVKGDVSDWLDQGHDPEELDQLADQASPWAPAPPPPPKPYTDDKEARRDLRTLARHADKLDDGNRTLADEVAVYFEREGPDKLGKQYPAAYMAKALGISRQQLYRLRDVGRIRRLLTGCTVTTAKRGPLDTAVHTLAVDLPEFTLRPLALLPPEQVPAALAAAEIKAQARGVYLNATHVADAVAETLTGEPVTAPIKPARPRPDEQETLHPADATHVLRQMVNDAISTAAGIRDLPTPIFQGLLASRRELDAWATVTDR